MSQPQLLATDLVIGESARWHDGRLWLSNWGAQEILAYGLEGIAKSRCGCYNHPVLHRFSASERSCSAASMPSPRFPGPSVNCSTGRATLRLPAGSLPTWRPYPM